MATLEQLQAALVAADRAGATDDARALAAEIVRMRGAPAPAAPIAAPVQQPAAQPAAAVAPPSEALAQIEANRDRTTGQMQGLARGAADIGDTLISVAKNTPVGFALRTAFPSLDKADAERRASMESFTTENQDRPGFMGGRITTNVLGTLGAPQALAGGAAAMGLPRLGAAIETAGFRAGAAPAASNLLQRVVQSIQSGGVRAAGGAIGGGASAALVNPDDALAGAGIGAALPFGAQAAGAAGRAVGRAVAAPFASTADRVAPVIGAAAGPQASTVLQSLRNAQQLVPGSVPTAGQAAMDPAISTLERAAQAAGGRGLADAYIAQDQARQAALRGLGQQGRDVASVREDLGQEVVRRVLPEERTISKQVSDLYDPVRIDPDKKSAIRLPIQEMQEIQQKYLGKGALTQGGDANKVMDYLKSISMPHSNGPFVDWQEMDAIRKSVAGMARGARTDPARAQEAAALEAMRDAIDRKVADVAGGKVGDGEVFTPEMQAALQSARAAHANKQQRFKTGPQGRLFRRDATGAPAMDPGDVPGAFWNGTPGQASDVEAYRRLVGDNTHMMDMLRSLGLTEAGAARTTAGELSATKFGDWVRGHAPAIDALYDPQQANMLRAIQDDLERSARAESLGRVRSGSDTMQKYNAMMGNSLLESPLAGWVANAVPGLRAYAGPRLNELRQSSRAANAGMLSEVLADPQATADALQAYLATQQATTRAPNQLQVLLGRAAPVALGSR